MSLSAPFLLSARPWRERLAPLLQEGLLLAVWVLAAATVNQLLVTVWSLPSFGALSLSMFLALAGHLFARRWLTPRQHVAPAPDPQFSPSMLSIDQAVEQGRGEERLRIAQDLHDDIGARLLTLMYQAPNAEIEEYIRHTIQDLKTLTRGLAVQSHCLSAAAAEWKRDLSHRLRLARCDLLWELAQDKDVALSMVQWSALTRILRELVSNIISHAQATRLEVRIILKDEVLTLSVVDNGVGRDPGAWAHGLGLGGVRKRVKQLGGSVSWTELAPQGICCEVVVPDFSGGGVGDCSCTPPEATDAQASH